MNWFNLEDLETRLVDNEVSDREGFNYLLANILLFNLAMYGVSDTYSHSAFLWADIILNLIIAFTGIKFTFDVNRAGDGNCYFKRFLALYFVNGIRLVVFSLFLAIPVALVLMMPSLVIFEGTSMSPAAGKDILYFVLIISLNIIFYYLLVRSFKRVAQTKTN